MSNLNSKQMKHDIQGALAALSAGTDLLLTQQDMPQTQLKLVHELMNERMKKLEELLISLMASQPLN